MSEKSDKSSGRSSRRSKKEKSPPPSVEVTARNQAVYAIYRRLIPVALLSVISAAFALFAAFSVWSVRTPPQYVQLHEDGRLIVQRPIGEPSIPQGVLSSFALDAIRALNTYDYINWRTQLQAATVYFSPRAWGDYQKAYQEARTLDAVTKRKMVVSVEPAGPVAFLQEGIVGGSGEYAWRVSVPVKVSYTPHDIQSGSPNLQEGEVILVISRVPLEVNPNGYAIQTYVFKPRRI